MNTVSLIGRLTSDPTARTDAEHPSAAFRLAVAASLLLRVAGSHSAPSL